MCVFFMNFGTVLAPSWDQDWNPFGLLLDPKRGGGVKGTRTFCPLGPKLGQVAPPDPLQDPFWDEVWTILDQFLIEFQQVFVLIAVCFAYLS